MILMPIMSGNVPEEEDFKIRSGERWGTVVRCCCMWTPVEQQRRRRGWTVCLLWDQNISNKLTFNMGWTKPPAQIKWLKFWPNSSVPEGDWCICTRGPERALHLHRLICLLYIFSASKSHHASLSWSQNFSVLAGRLLAPSPSLESKVVVGNKYKMGCWCTSARHFSFVLHTHFYIHTSISFHPDSLFVNTDGSQPSPPTSFRCHVSIFSPWSLCIWNS